MNDCNDYAMLCYAMMKIYMWICWSGLVCLHRIACVRGWVVDYYRYNLLLLGFYMVGWFQVYVQSVM